MKNFKFIFAAALACAALSCERDPLLESAPEVNQESNLVPLVLTTGDDTKTSLQSDGSIHWSDGDAISVIDNGVAHIGETNIHSFAISNIRGSKATFTGNVRRSTSQICAVYPSSAVVSGDVGGTFGTGDSRDVKVTIPAEQTAKAGSFNDDLNISVAKVAVSLSADNTLPSSTTITFKNVCALLSFTMPSTLPGTITSVTFSSSVAIAGNMDIDYSGDTPVCSISSDQKHVTLTGDFAAGKTYWFVVAPVKLNGISIAVTDSEGNVYRKSKSGEVQMNQGTYRSLGTLNFDKMMPIVVSAEHTYGESDILTGTKLTMTFPHTDVTGINLTVKKDGTTVRTITSAAGFSNGVITNEKTENADWPYLPKGSYTVSGTYTSAVDGVIDIIDAPFTVSATPTPRSITYFDPYTSYTNKDNNLNGSTIYANFKVNVSDEILTKSEYTGLFKASMNGSAASGVSLSNNVLACSLADQAWQAHTITSVTCSFDGSSVNNNVSHNPGNVVYVTGIPYSYSFKDVANVDDYKSAGWTMNGDISVESILGNKGFALSRGWRERTGGSIIRPTYTEYKYKGYVVSPAFYIPGDTSVQANVLTSGYVSLGSSRNVKGYVGPVASSNAQCGTSISYNTNCSMNPWGSNSGTDAWYGFNLNSSNNRVSVACDQVYDNNSTMYYFLNGFSLRYAE